MKNLFTAFSNRTYITGILLGIILFIFIAEVFLRTYVIPQDNLSRIAVSVYESEKQDVLIGDSQFVYGFPQGLPQFENLSNDGMPVEAMEIILREYYRHNEPSRVIIIAGPQMLAKNRVERGDWGFNDFFKPNVIDHPFMLYTFEKLVSRNLADLSKWTGGMHHEKFKEEMWEEMEIDERMEITRKRLEIQRPAENFINTRNFNSYYRIIELLKDKNADICLLRMPVSVEYLELTRNDTDYMAAEAAFKEMAGSYGVKYVDFRQIPLSYDSSFFLNSDHLNEKGRKLFATHAGEFCFGK